MRSSSILLSTLLFFFATSCFSQKNLSLRIENPSSINFWEPIEVQVNIKNNLSIAQKLVCPPFGRLSIGIEGTEEWEYISYETPLGRVVDRDPYYCYLEADETISIPLLIPPVSRLYRERGQYTFSPGQTYELRFEYNSTYPQGAFDQLAYSVIKINGKTTDQDFLIIDGLEDPFFLFDPQHRSHKWKMFYSESEQIAEIEESIFSKWARLYLFICDYNGEYAVFKTSNSSTEEKQKMEQALIGKYQVFRETCDSDYIREYLDRRLDPYYWLR